MGVLQVAFDVLWSNSDLHSNKAVTLCIGNIAKLYVFATSKEITVSKQRHEVALKDQVQVSDSDAFPRCCQLFSKGTSIHLKPHSIHEAENHVTHLLVYVPKPSKRQPYFKLRTAYRYVLQLDFPGNTLPSRLPLRLEEEEEDQERKQQYLRVYEPIVLMPLAAPVPAALVLPVPPLKPLDRCGPNLFLEHTFAEFKCFTPLEQLFQEFLLSFADDTPLKWTRYVLYDLVAARGYVDPISALSNEIIRLQSMIMHGFVVLWQLFCTLAEAGMLDRLLSAHGIVASLLPLFAQIRPLCEQVYRSPYALLKRAAQRLLPLTWPHGPKALEQIMEDGFVHSPSLLQRDRAICRHCSFVAFAWRRLLPPRVHHHPICPKAMKC